MAELETEFRIDCRDGSAVEIILDEPGELAQIAHRRQQAAAERDLQDRKVRALARLRKCAETDLVLDDLLITLGLA